MNDHGYRMKRNGKYWQVTWPGLVRPDGKPKWISTGKLLGTDATREDVEQFLIEQRVKHASRPETARVQGTGALTVGEWLATDTGYFTYVEDELTEATIQIQKRAANRLIEVYGANTAIDSISVEDGKRFTRALIDEGLSTSTVCQQVRCAKKFMNTAKKLRKIIDNPFDDLRSNPPKNSKRAKERRALVTESELRAVIDADPRLHALLMICFHTGLRTHEVLSARHSHVDFETMTIEINSKKTGKRIVPCSPELYEEMCLAGRNWMMTNYKVSTLELTQSQLGEKLRNDNGLCCFLDEGRHPSSVWTQINRACIKAGVEPFSIQDLRVTRANIWAKDPDVGPVRSAKFMGHSERVQEKEYREFDAVDFRTVTRLGEDRRTKAPTTTFKVGGRGAQVASKMGDAGLETKASPLKITSYGNLK